MRPLDSAFAAHLQTGATTLCHCWRIVRADAVVLGFTDHDRALSFAGTDFTPASGLDGAERVARAGPEVTTGEVLGVLDAEAITEDDILLGRYDGARVETWRVNWKDPSVRLLERVDTIGEIVREDGVFRAELRSAQHAMNVPRGRVYQAQCDAELGDPRCGVTLATAQFRGLATVTAVAGRARVEVSGAGEFTSGWFTHGIAEWTAGRRAGKRDRIAGHQRHGGVVTISFGDPVGAWVAPGDTVTLFAGCDRRFSTCRQKFANTLNFRGFPHIPGHDAILRYPREGDRFGGRPLVK